MQDEEGAAATAYDGRRAAVVAVLCVTVLVTLLVTWAASIGPGDVLRGGGLADFGATPTVSPTTSTATATTTVTGGEPGPGSMPLALQVVTVILLVLTALALLGLVALAVRALWLLRPKRRRARREHVDFDVVEAPDSADAVAQEMAADAAEQLGLLRTGSPRNGIVACWARFEEQAARAGVRPEAWETSSEFALRILEMVRADTSAVSGLAILFREARYSEHEVTEEQRNRAIELLEGIHASLGRPRERSRS